MIGAVGGSLSLVFGETGSDAYAFDNGRYFRRQAANCKTQNAGSGIFCSLLSIDFRPKENLDGEIELTLACE